MLTNTSSRGLKESGEVEVVSTITEQHNHWSSQLLIIQQMTHLNSSNKTLTIIVPGHNPMLGCFPMAPLKPPLVSPVTGRVVFPLLTASPHITVLITFPILTYRYVGPIQNTLKAKACQVMGKCGDGRQNNGQWKYICDSQIHNVNKYLGRISRQVLWW